MICERYFVNIVVCPEFPGVCGFEFELGEDNGTDETKCGRRCVREEVRRSKCLFLGFTRNGSRGRNDKTVALRYDLEECPGRSWLGLRHFEGQKVLGTLAS